MKLDVLAIAAHPDDAELGCGGTLAALAEQGKTTGILDLTCGELGTRGTPDLRLQEAAVAAQALGIQYRANAGLKDGFFQNDADSQRAVIRFIRYTKPEVLLINAPEDRHPDHGRAHCLANDAAFLSGLSRIVTHWNDEVQLPWRPKAIAAYIQDRYLEPSFCIPLKLSHVELKMKSIRAYESQFYNPDRESQHPEEHATYISSSDFLDWIQARMLHFGHRVGHRWAEGFVHVGPLTISSPLDLLVH
jgi:N-acetylglucosamine malate deacetylase 1